MNLRWKLNDIASLFINVKKLEQKEASLEFEDFLSVVCIAKDEARYIKEWVDFHLLIGIDRIYVYDNDS